MKKKISEEFFINKTDMGAVCKLNFTWLYKVDAPVAAQVPVAGQLSFLGAI